MQPTLYFTPNCTYSNRVFRFLDQLGLDVTFMNINERPILRDYLIQERGSATVPVLGIQTPEGTALLGESLDIMAWLEFHAPSLKKAI